MMTYEMYDNEMHKLFESAFNIRNNPNSDIDELQVADDYLYRALGICTEMEQDKDDDNIEIKIKITTNRLRCYIERIAIHTRLMKMVYDTPLFETAAEKLEKLCYYYSHVHIPVSNVDIEQSAYQLNVIINQSMAANYFRKGGMGKNKELCNKAIEYINKAIGLTANDEGYNKIMRTNKEQILSAIS